MVMKWLTGRGLCGTGCCRTWRRRPWACSTPGRTPRPPTTPRCATDCVCTSLVQYVVFSRRVAGWFAAQSMAGDAPVTSTGNNSVLLVDPDAPSGFLTQVEVGQARAPPDPSASYGFL